MLETFAPGLGANMYSSGFHAETSKSISRYEMQKPRSPLHSIGLYVLMICGDGGATSVFAIIGKKRGANLCLRSIR